MDKPESPFAVALLTVTATLSQPSTLTPPDSTNARTCRARSASAAAIRSGAQRFWLSGALIGTIRGGAVEVWLFVPACLLQRLLGVARDRLSTAEGDRPCPGGGLGDEMRTDRGRGGRSGLLCRAFG